MDAGTPDPPEPVTLELIGSSPAPGATNVETDTDIEFVFDQDVSILSGDFALHRVADDSVFESVAINSPQVNVSGASVNIDLDGVLAGSTEYYVTLEASALDGAAGAPFAGINVDSARNFTTASVSLPGAVSDGPALWLDAAFTGSIKTAGGAVSVWGDRSGNNSSVRQANSAAQPTLALTGINANPVVVFDGSSDVLNGPVLDPLQAYDVFIVWRSPLVPITTNFIHLLRSGPSLEINHGHLDPNFLHSGASEFAAGWAPAQFEDPAINTTYVWNLSFDPSAGTLTAFTNGTATSTVSDLVGMPVTTTDPLTIGSRWSFARHFNGEIGEIILYRRTLSAPERNQIQSYLDAKWGL
jgi:hypothetical protein